MTSSATFADLREHCDAAISSVVRPLEELKNLLSNLEANQVDVLMTNRSLEGTICSLRAEKERLEEKVAELSKSPLKPFGGEKIADTQQQVLSHDDAVGTMRFQNDTLDTASTVDNNDDRKGKEGSTTHENDTKDAVNNDPVADGFQEILADTQAMEIDEPDEATNTRLGPKLQEHIDASSTADIQQTQATPRDFCINDTLKKLDITASDDGIGEVGPTSWIHINKASVSSFSAAVEIDCENCGTSGASLIDNHDPVIGSSEEVVVDTQCMDIDEPKGEAKHDKLLLADGKKLSNMETQVTEGQFLPDDESIRLSTDDLFRGVSVVSPHDDIKEDPIVHKDVIDTDSTFKCLQETSFDTQAIEQQDEEGEVNRGRTTSHSKEDGAAGLHGTRQKSTFQKQVSACGGITAISNADSIKIPCVIASEDGNAIYKPTSNNKEFTRKRDTKNLIETFQRDFCDVQAMDIDEIDAEPQRKKPKSQLEESETWKLAGLHNPDADDQVLVYDAENERSAGDDVVDDVINNSGAIERNAEIVEHSTTKDGTADTVGCGSTIIEVPRTILFETPNEDSKVNHDATTFELRTERKSQFDQKCDTFHNQVLTSGNLIVDSFVRVVSGGSDTSTKTIAIHK